MNDLNAKSSIKIITTGGTIDKSYDEVDGQLINKNSIVRERILNKLRLPYTDLIIETVLSKDSLEMDDADRKVLSSAIKRSLETSPSTPIVVLHGTDTLHTSADFCSRDIQNLSRPVIFTGAMVPSEMENSDAWQNVAEALMVARLIDPGIYLSFHGRLYKSPNFRKNRPKRTFEAYQIEQEKA